MRTGPSRAACFVGSMPAFNYERAARILVEAEYYGDAEAAKRAGVSTRSIQRWRRRMESDAHLSSFVALKKREFEQDWAGALAGGILAGIEFLQRAARDANPKDPNAIHAIAGAVKILAEIGITKAVLDVKLASLRAENGTPDGEDITYILPEDATADT